MMRLAMLTGSIPFASWLAACGGDDDDDDDDDDTGGGGDDDPTATEDSGGGDSDDPTATSDQSVSGTAAEATATPDEGARQGGTLRLGFGIGQVLSLDPAQVTQGIVAGELISNIFSSLVQFDENLGLVADLAEDWTVSDDGIDYTFNLRDGLTFHNGDSLTADDFIYTYERTINEDFASPHANKLVLVTEITAVDDLTLNVKLSDPFAPFLAVACSRGPGRALTPISRRAIDEMGDEQFGQTPVGCGPFMLVEGSREIGEGFDLEAFEGWYAGRPLVDKIEVRIIPEPSTRVSALEAGDVDMLDIAPTSGVEQLEGNDDITVVQAPGTNWVGLNFNHERPPWDQLNARLAVAKAIDRVDFIERAFFGLATPAHSAIAPAFGWVYHSDPGDDPQAYDLDEAKRLAAEAGLDGLQPHVLADVDNPRPAEVLRNAVAEIGIDLQLDLLQNAAANERWQASDFDWDFAGSVVDADPDDGHWNHHHSTGPWNRGFYNNPEADALLEKTRTTSDVEERKQAWLDLEKILQEDVPYAYLYHTPDFIAFRNFVMGYRPIPEMRYLESIWLDN